MTTEDDFLAVMRVDHDDRTLRLVFADFLQDRDDPRADGFRAMTALGLCLITDCWFNAANYLGRPPEDTTNFPSAWFVLLNDGKFRNRTMINQSTVVAAKDADWCDYPTDLAAELAAAVAFSKLPAEIRRRLLAGEFV